jgi:hypothetical protein
MNNSRDRFAGRKAGLAALLLGLVLSTTAAVGQVSISINVPGVNIGINVPTYPQLVRVPGYPVYYAPRLRSNYFFYDGMYWVYQDDDWYASSWYDGPWARVDPVVVPLFVLRIPVRYYRNPPQYFRAWRRDGPPRWDEHWGRDWEQRRHGWDRWSRQSVPAPAPLPIYQRQYRGDRYPDVAQQPLILGRNYNYRPRDQVVRQHFEEHAVQRAPAPSQQRTPPARVREERMPVPQRAPEHDARNQPPPPLRAEPPVQARPQPMPRPPQQQAPREPAPQAQAPHQQPPHQQPPPPHQQPPRAPAPQQVPPRAVPERQVQPAPEQQPGRAPAPSSHRANPGEKGQGHEGKPERGKDRERD